LFEIDATRRSAIRRRHARRPADKPACSCRGKAVLDAFLGSDTTLIAVTENSRLSGEFPASYHGFSEGYREKQEAIIGNVISEVFPRWGLRRHRSGIKSASFPTHQLKNSRSVRRSRFRDQIPPKLRHVRADAKIFRHISASTSRLTTRGHFDGWITPRLGDSVVIEGRIDSTKAGPTTATEEPLRRDGRP
jgi:hypothetical protein